MTEIQLQIQEMTALISGISSSSIEQTRGISQINQAVIQLDRATQQNAALVEESAAAAESLHQQADQLSGAVAGFKTD